MVISSKENLKVMRTFNEKNFPNLDVCVLGALEFFNDSKLSLPKLKINYKKPLIVGSGNAQVVGEIIFEDCDSVFASESDFLVKLKKIKSIDGVVVISSSGGKHCPMIIKTAKKYNKKVTLITNNKDSIALSELEKNDKVFVFPKQREPYTYNTSTYMGMILSKTNESPSEIYSFIESNYKDFNFSIFKKYDKFYLIVPSEFSSIKRMIQIKFIELFGRRIARDIETIEYLKHATTVVPSKRELFISFGKKLNLPNKHQLVVPLPKKCNYATIMAISYYLIGKIQSVNKPYFKKYIKAYTKEASKEFNQKIEVIVE